MRVAAARWTSITGAFKRARASPVHPLARISPRSPFHGLHFKTKQYIYFHTFKFDEFKSVDLNWIVFFSIAILRIQFNRYFETLRENGLAIYSLSFSLKIEPTSFLQARAQHDDDAASTVHSCRFHCLSRAPRSLSSSISPSPSHHSFESSRV